MSQSIRYSHDLEITLLGGIIPSHLKKFLLSIRVTTGYLSFIGVGKYLKYVLFLLESKESTGASYTYKSFVISNTRFFVLPIATTYDSKAIC
ncbi:hypothetical protein DERP_003838 [Dermatophagoides pteronyssinus]|uniref:Uncharacterized protein n=1 Tax=Dermatophagoides pteronyssinus TaxID=6956 RepID=A0ABQ8JM56_DERPT|nr:hypothetical protein DERP_003838 [Dermatophagoides pteronyssinus]